MRHGYFGKKLSRTKNERRRLLMGLARELIKRGEIKTTLPKAKAVQSLVEKLLTLARRGTSAATGRLLQELADKKLVKVWREEVSTRFQSRPSGFTRIIKLGRRQGDAAEIVSLSFVDAKVAPAALATKSEKGKQEQPRRQDKKNVKSAKTKVKAK